MKKINNKWMIENQIPNDLVPIKFCKESHKAVLSKPNKEMDNYVRKPYDESYFEIGISKDTNQIYIKEMKDETRT